MSGSSPWGRSTYTSQVIGHRGQEMKGDNYAPSVTSIDARYRFDTEGPCYIITALDGSLNWTIDMSKLDGYRGAIDHEAKLQEPKLIKRIDGCSWGSQVDMASYRRSIEEIGLAEGWLRYIFPTNSGLIYYVSGPYKELIITGLGTFHEDDPATSLIIGIPEETQGVIVGLRWWEGDKEFKNAWLREFGGNSPLTVPVPPSSERTRDVDRGRYTDFERPRRLAPERELPMLLPPLAEPIPEPMQAARNNRSNSQQFPWSVPTSRASQPAPQRQPAPSRNLQSTMPMPGASPQAASQTTPKRAQQLYYEPTSAPRTSKAAPQTAPRHAQKPSRQPAPAPRASQAAPQNATNRGKQFALPATPAQKAKQSAPPRREQFSLPAPPVQKAKQTAAPRREQFTLPVPPPQNVTQNAPGRPQQLALPAPPPQSSQRVSAQQSMRRPHLALPPPEMEALPNFNGVQADFPWAQEGPGGGMERETVFAPRGPRGRENRFGRS